LDLRSRSFAASGECTLDCTQGRPFQKVIQPVEPAPDYACEVTLSHRTAEERMTRLGNCLISSTKSYGSLGLPARSYLPMLPHYGGDVVGEVG
jgi:hypothetical protein